MTAAEVQFVLRALRKAVIPIVTLHNLMIGEPAFDFTHFWGKGRPRTWPEGSRVPSTRRPRS